MIAQPGLLTCNQNHPREALAADGYRWQSYQAWNQGRRGPLDTGGDYDLNEDRKYGISPGVWGVIYDLQNFYSDGKGLAMRALELGAEHLMLDMESCLKNTYPNGARPAVQGVRDGGWLGPVHLTTLGAPEKNPTGGFWDYAFDLDSFLQTGGGILPQAYYAEISTPSGRAPTLAADLCVDYFCDQESVPRDRVNLMIWPDGTNPIQTEIDLLQKAGLGQAMSVFLTESTSMESFDALREVTLATPAPEPEPPFVLPGTMIGDQHGITAMCDFWRSLWPSKTKPNRDPTNLSTWGAIDKLERTLLTLRADHDAWVRGG